MSEFHVGQQVVCVDDVWTQPPEEVADNRPVKNVHYIIRHVWTEPDGDGVLLNNVVNPVCRCSNWCGQIYEGEPGFCATRFRPIRAESIAIFREMCKAKSRVKT